MAEKQTAGRNLLGEFAPKFAELNDDVLFGEVWSREEELSSQHRSMITISALIAKGNYEQLTPHFQKAKDNGLTKKDIVEMITHLAFYVGWPEAWSAFGVAQKVFDNDTEEEGKDKNEDLKNSTIFPLGDKVNSENFIGDTYVSLVFTDEEPLNTGIGNVTFAPRARNSWHSHEVGQVLLVTGGEGWYQEEGKEAQLLRTGDVVNISPNVKHWHGATKDSWFVHLAMTPGQTNWFEPVEDEWYDNL